MKRRKFLRRSTTLAAGTLLTSAVCPGLNLLRGAARRGKFSRFSHRLPKTDFHFKVTSGYVEDDPVPEYSWASDESYDAFLDMKFGIRLHWGPYSILQQRNESWPFLAMSFQERQAYQEMYKTWDPQGFNANEWVDLFADSGAKMFSFTTKHHDGFSMFDTKTRVKKRTNWMAPGGPSIEDCDLAYSMMESPFKRDVVKELTDAAHKRNINVDLYFSHPDWYDADFRPYNYHPLQVPDASTIAVLGKERRPENPQNRFGKTGVVMVPNTSAEGITRMMKRHREQLEEIITKYGKIKMVCLDQWLGPTLWPQLRDTILHLRKLRPDIMFRARGIGNYGDYYTPEGFVPGNKENSDTPWFVIYPLGSSFSYEADEAKYKGSKWIINNLIDSVAKGGNFMAGIGPDGNGRFHPRAVEQLKQTGAWLRMNGEAIYGTRAREGELWKEGEKLRFTRTKNNKTIFALCLDWPGDRLIIQSVKPKERAKISLLGTNAALNWNYDSTTGLVIELPSALMEKVPVAGRLAYSFKIEV